MPDAPPLVLLCNPDARLGRTLARARALLAGAPDLARRAEAAELGDRASAERAVAAIPTGAVPVVAGGDGTAALVAAAWLRAGRGAEPIGLLPLGSGNALAHALGVARREAALAALRAGTVRRLDAMATTHPDAPLALVSLSAGLEGRLMTLAAGARRGARWLGLLRRGPGVLRAAAAAEVELDGVGFSSAGEALVSVGLYNLPCYGFGWRVWRGAEGGDGVAHAVAVDTLSRYARVILRGLDLDAPPPAGVRHRPWRTARVRSASPWQADGEAVPPGAFEVTLLPGAVGFLVPRPA